MERVEYDMRHTIFSLENNNGKTRIRWNYDLLSNESINKLKEINKIYDKQYFIWFNDNRRKLKLKSIRKCRFCSKSYPEVKFSKKAHTFPESFGNKNHLSDFECDNCNYKFGIIENDFANFLSPLRTLSEISGKKGIPKFKSRDKELTIEQVCKNTIDIKLNEIGVNNTRVFEDENGILSIVTEGIPYKPINIFKCLLKTALSLVDEEDLSYLSESINFLMNDNYEKEPSNDFILSMQQYFIPGNFNVPPFVVHYKKNINFSNHPSPSLIFVFYIANITFQIFVPFHEKDTIIYTPNQERKMYVIPPLIKQEYLEKFGGPFARFYNLNDHIILNKNIQVQQIKYFENK